MPKTPVRTRVWFTLCSVPERIKANDGSTASERITRRTALTVVATASAATLLPLGCRTPAEAAERASVPPRPLPAPRTETPLPAPSALPASEAHTSAAAGPAASVAPDTSSPLVCERLVAMIGRNHGHELSIAASEVVAAADHEYQLRGKADHSHTIVITADEFRALGRGQVLRKKTERGGADVHRHRVLLRCEPLHLPPDKTNVCKIQIGGRDDHELLIPESHLHMGVDQVYDIQGISEHTHQLVLNADHFAKLIKGMALDVTTGYGLGHFHHVYIRYPLGNG